MKEFLALRIADGLGSGQLKPAPGTWGSLAITIVLFLWQPTVEFAALAFMLSIPVSYWATDLSMEIRHTHDPGWIVIDEWQGMLIVWMIADPHSALEAGIAFFAFRVFDVIKLPPASTIDRSVTNAWGVLCDDWIAGIYAGCAIAIGMHLF